MKRLRILAALAVLSTSGCAALLDFLRSSFQQPSFTFQSVALTNVSLEGLTLDTIWRLDNPNSIALSLAQINYALFIENKQVVSGSPPQGLQIGARASSELHFPASIKFQDLAQVVDTFLTKDTATWRAQGGIGVQTPIGIVSLPLQKEGVFEVPKVPQVRFEEPRVSNVSFTGATIEFPLVVQNRNTYALPINGIRGTVSIGGAPIGTLSTGDLGGLGGRATRQVTLPLNVSFLGAAGAVVNAVRGGSSQVRFDAQVQSGNQSVPLVADQLLQFTH